MRYFFYVIVFFLLVGCHSHEKLDDGIEFFERKEYEVALVHFTEYLQENPNSAEAVEYQARTLIELKQYPQAAMYLRQLMQLIEIKPQLYNTYGNVSYKQGMVDSALYYFKKAYAMDSTVDMLNYNLAVVYFNDIKDDTLALYHINKELTMSPVNVDILGLKAHIMLGLGQDADVIPLAEKIRSLSPESAESYVLLAIVCFRGEAYNCALDQYSKAIRLGPPDADTYTRRASIYGIFRDYKAALNDLDTAIRLDAGCVDAYELRHLAYMKLGMRDKACADLYTLRQLDPAHPALEYLQDCPK